MLFAPLQPETFQEVVESQALDVGRGTALLPEEDMRGSALQALCLCG